MSSVLPTRSFLLLPPCPAASTLRTAFCWSPHFHQYSVQ